MGLDFGAFQAGQGAVGDPTSDILNRQVAQLQMQGQALQNRAAESQLQMQHLELERQQTFGSDIQSFLAAPSATGVAALFGKYPEFAKQISDSWNTLDTAQRRSDATQLGSVASLIAKGDYDNAAKLVQTRIDADRAAGRDSSQDEQALSMLQSGDPKQQKAVLGLATIEAAGAVGPDKAAEWLNGLGLGQAPTKLGPGEALVNPLSGDTIASQSPLLQHVEVNNVDGSQTATTFNPYTGAFGGAAVQGSSAPAEGGGPASGGATGLQGSVATVLHNEGGYNPKDANGSPTNFGINFKANQAVLAKMGINASNFKDMTRAQAEQIYATKYWPQSGAASLAPNLQAPYFDAYVRSPALAKAALRQSGGDPVKFVQIASANFQKMASNPNSGTHVYANAWANRDANNLAIASGGAPAAPNSPVSDAAPATGQASPYTFGGSSSGVNNKGAPNGFVWNADHTGVVPLKGGDQDPGSYSPEMLDDAAKQFIVTGQMPSMGMGGAAMKKAILTRRSQIMQQLGITAGDLPALQSRYAADKKSLEQNTTLLSALNSSEGALVANAKQVIATQKALLPPSPDNPDGLDIIDNGSPILNRTRVATYKQVGSAKTKAAIKAYEDAVNAYATEYAKFMSSASGLSNAPSSDAARNQAGELNDKGMGPAALMSHIHQSLIEAQNKKNAVAAQNQALQQRLASYLQPKQSAPASRTPPSGATATATGPGGKKIALVNGHWVPY